MRTLPTAVLVTLTVVTVAIVPRVNAQQPADSAARRQQRTADSLATALRALEARLDSLSRGPVSAPEPPAQPAPQARAAGAYMNVSFVGLTDFGWSTTRDIASLQRGDHDPKVRGFSIPNGELALDGTVDPYFKGFSNIVYKLDSHGETGVELEEMYFITTSLPLNLQLKGGQFFTEFGRQNPQHPHSWGFVDQPLVLSRMFGPEGLRSQGARLSWLLPTSFYTEAMLTVANSAGGTAFSFRSDESSAIHGGVALDAPVRGPKDLLIAPRIATSFELSSTQTVLAGVSAAFGPNNSGAASRTTVMGADVYWKWKSPTAHQGFPFVSFTSEVMFRRYGAAARASAENPAVQLPAETLHDRGMYGELLYGIKPRVVVGFRGEFASGDFASFTSDLRTDRYRFSPNLTWYPSEFSKFRIQYNYDHRTGLGVDHSLWMQFEFLLGAHAAHKF